MDRAKKPVVNQFLIFTLTTPCLDHCDDIHDLLVLFYLTPLMFKNLPLPLSTNPAPLNGFGKVCVVAALPRQRL
jgi:hypothetical protein